MSRVKGSNFDKLVEHLNSYKAGDMIFRRDLLKVVYGDPHRSNTTVDKWRRQFTVCEYLEETGFPGMYKRTAKHISDYLSSSNLEFDARYELDDWYRKHDPSRIAP